MTNISYHIGKSFFIVGVLFLVSCQSPGTKEKEQVTAVKKDSILSCCQVPSRFGTLKKKDSTVQKAKPYQK